MKDPGKGHNAFGLVKMSSWTCGSQNCRSCFRLKIFSKDVSMKRGVVVEVRI